MSSSGTAPLKPKEGLSGPPAEIIRAICEGRIDIYEGWQQVCRIFQNNAGLGLPELEAFVQIEGVDPNSSLSVTEELLNRIKQNAVRFVANG